MTAGAGVRVRKHGNRSFTSRSGSADVLEAIGVAIDIAPDRAASILHDIGIVFLFAPTYHPAMRHVAAVRRQLATATVMNLVGPLANPAGARRQVLGVADPARGPIMADALLRLGSHRALVVHGVIGIDEVSPVGRTLVWEVAGGGVTEWSIDAEALGFAVGSSDGMAGGEPADNARQVEELLTSPSAATPALTAAVLLNAAAAIMVSGDGETLESALARARRSLASGAAAGRLEALRRASPLSTSG